MTLYVILKYKIDVITYVKTLNRAQIGRIVSYEGLCYITSRRDIIKQVWVKHKEKSYQYHFLF